MKRVVKMSKCKSAIMLAVLLLGCLLQMSTLKVCAEEEPVACIGETTYQSLEEAFAAAQRAGSGRITVLKDVTVERRYIWLESGNIIWDLNGHTVNMGSTRLMISGPASLTICDDSGEQTGMLNITPEKQIGAMIEVEEGAACTINSGNYYFKRENNTNRDGVISNEGTFTINGGRIETCGFSWMLLSSGPGIATISAGELIAKDDSINILAHSKLVITGGKLSSTNMECVHLQSKADAEISGGTITSATAAYVINTSVANPNRLVISGSVEILGGTVCAIGDDCDDLIVTGGTIISNGDIGIKACMYYSPGNIMNNEGRNHLSGNAIIKGNKTDIYLPSQQVLRIDGPLTNTEPYRVSLAGDTALAKGYVIAVGSDRTGYVLTKEDVKKIVCAQSTVYEPVLNAEKNQIELDYIPQNVSTSVNWNDLENQLGVRPESVSVALMYDGNRVASAEANSANDWTVDFGKYVVYGADTTQILPYTVAVAGVPEEYNITISGDAKVGFAVDVSLKHQHTWGLQYTSSDKQNEVEVVCTKAINTEACDLAGSVDKITIMPPTQSSYDGTIKTATIAAVSDVAIVEPVIYKKWNGTAWDTCTEAKAVGKYQASAKVSVGSAEKTISVTFEVEALEMTGVTVKPYEGSYLLPYDTSIDNKTAAVSVTGVPADAIIEYSTDDGNTWSQGVPLLENAGTLTIKVRVSCVGYKEYIQEVTAAKTPYDLEDTASCGANGENWSLRLAGGDAFAYTGNAIQPAIAGIQNSKINYTLQEGVDYTLSYGENSKAGTGTVTLNGKGNYTGSVQADFTIYKVDIEDVRLTKEYLYLEEAADVISLTDYVPSDAGEISYQLGSVNGDCSFIVAPVIVNGVLNYTVAAGIVGNSTVIPATVTTDKYKDFEVQVTITMADKQPVVEKSGSEVALKNNVLTFGEALSKLEFKEAVFVAEKTGEVVTGTLAWESPTKTPDVVTTNATWVFTPDDRQYASVAGNIAIVVQPASIKSEWIKWTDGFEGQVTYNGKEFTPQIEVVFGANVLVLGQDYSVQYVNNKNAYVTEAAAMSSDTAPAVVVTGMGNFAGMVNKTFAIQKAPKAPNMPEETKTVANSVVVAEAVELPVDWVWEDKTVELAEGSQTAVAAIYNGADKGNYEIEKVVVVITREAKQTVVENKPDDNKTQEKPAPVETKPVEITPVKEVYVSPKTGYENEEVIEVLYGLAIVPGIVVVPALAEQSRLSALWILLLMIGLLFICAGMEYSRLKRNIKQ